MTTKRTNQTSKSLECQIESVVPVAKNPIEALQQAIVALRPFTDSFSRVVDAVTPCIQGIEPYIKGFGRYSNFIDSVSATGWLPYYTVSVDWVERIGPDTTLLGGELARFYTKNWEGIREDIESRLDQYRISEETRDTFREALRAHEIGHYRCVCRVLFPQIDREFRIHFCDDHAGSISAKRMLGRLTDRGSIKDFMPGEAYGWILFGKLIYHLYEPVGDDNRRQFEQDYIPNRHASMHGLVPYSTHKHSMNMIIMADYIFQILTSTAELP